MYYLSIGVGGGDVQEFKREDMNQVIELVKELEYRKCIFLVADGDCAGEIMITENYHKMIEFIRNMYFFELGQPQELHIHEYESFEDAYKVALDMREGHPKCYN